MFCCLTLFLCIIVVKNPAHPSSPPPWSSSSRSGIQNAKVIIIYFPFVSVTMHQLKYVAEHRHLNFNELSRLFLSLNVSITDSERCSRWRGFRGGRCDRRCGRYLGIVRREGFGRSRPRPAGKQGLLRPPSFCIYKHKYIHTHVALNFIPMGTNVCMQCLQRGECF